MCLGCYYHGCKDCEKEDFSRGKKKSWADRRKKTEVRNKYIEHHGFELEIKKECEWKRVSFIEVLDILL